MKQDIGTSTHAYYNILTKGYKIMLISQGRKVIQNPLTLSLFMVFKILKSRQIAA